MSNGVIPVGRVQSVSSRSFVVGCRVMQVDIPTFGSFVRADGRAPDSAIYGLICDVAMEDDLMVRRFVVSDPPEEVVKDQRDNRQVPIEVSVLVVGCCEGGRVFHRIPPQPPVTMDTLYRCAQDEVVAFTGRFDYFRLVLDAREVPADELLAASIGEAAAARPVAERDDFLLRAGRELARLLAGDLLRLDGVLRRLGERAGSPFEG